MDIFDLSGKVAIVTGGAGGIGLGIAKGLATAGATVVIANRRIQKGQEAAEYLNKQGFNAIAIPTDVSDQSSVASLVSKTVKDFGKIDILVNNAAVTRRGPPEDVKEEDWDYILNTNLKGLFFCFICGNTTGGASKIGLWCFESWRLSSDPGACLRMGQV
jgi:2-deoxy-D-gluconate 3-dehydrogenase